MFVFSLDDAALKIVTNEALEFAVGIRLGFDLDSFFSVSYE